MGNPRKKGGHHDSGTGGFARCFGWFNRVFEKTSGNDQRGVRGSRGRPCRFMAVFAALALVMGLLFARLPSYFLPNEDQGALMAMIQTPVGATQERTPESNAKLEKHFLENETEAVESVFAVQGFSFAGMGQNTGIAFDKIKNWSKRDRK